MNQNWHDFLDSLPAPSATSETKALYPVADFSLLKVTGTDAAAFLQGQLTCDIKALSAENSFFAALCNPKGRVISTLLIFKQADDFLLLLPTVLFETVKNTLQKYILRAKVHLHNASDEFCVSGLTCDEQIANHLDLPALAFSYQHNWIKLPRWHYLLIASVEDSVNRWNALLKQGFQLHTSANWSYVNINAGLAWLNDENSEEYIPQMLNLDKLGGISLTKGCYTGQEVVARTHYLGQSKRELFIAHCETPINLSATTGQIIDSSGETVGKILTAQSTDNHCRLLVILQSNALTKKLKLAQTEQQLLILL
jgi:folate-binding protein YgfZ